MIKRIIIYHVGTVMIIMSMMVVIGLVVVLHVDLFVLIFHLQVVYEPQHEMPSFWCDYEEYYTVDYFQYEDFCGHHVEEVYWEQKRQINKNIYNKANKVDYIRIFLKFPIYCNTPIFKNIF